MSSSEKNSPPKYSICMCNYNMADTLDEALTSILDQLDHHYEVVVADDGSSDNSIDVLKQLQKRYDNLRILSLKRDRKRKLGFTRNLCIQEARGDYVFLNVDCDDIYGPHIQDFAAVFHQIENCLDKDIYLSGQNINMAKKSFLLKHGPYRNLFRGEDRDMWVRFASIGAYLPLEHQNFVTRLPKPKTRRVKRALIHTWDDLQNILRTGISPLSCIRRDYQKFKNGTMTWKHFLCRIGMVFPAWFAAKNKEQILPPDNMNTAQKFKQYRDETGGTFSEIMKRNQCKPDFSVLSKDGSRIFY